MSLTFIPEHKEDALERIRQLGRISADINNAAKNLQDEFFYRDAFTVSATITYLKVIAQAIMIWHGLSPQETTDAYLSTASPERLPEAAKMYKTRHFVASTQCHDLRGVLGVIAGIEFGPVDDISGAPNAPKIELLQRASVLHAEKVGILDLDETYNIDHLDEVVDYIDQHIDYILEYAESSRDMMLEVYEKVRSNIPFGRYDDFDCVLKSEVKAMETYGPIFWSETMRMMGLGHVKGIIVGVDKDNEQVAKILQGISRLSRRETS
jgi:hypothetical protein